MAPRPRPLHSNEIALWREVTRSIVPLHGKGILQSVKDQPEPPAQSPATTKPQAARPAPSAQSLARLVQGKLGSTATLKPLPPGAGAKPSATPPLAPIERKLIKQVSRGHYDIDAVLDLHGYRQHDAHERLRRFLHRAQADHARLVLVVTGKGGTPTSRIHDGEPHAKGVLRRSVPEWLGMPDLRGVVMGFEQAAPHQGGSGALYVRLRRRKGQP